MAARRSLSSVKNPPSIKGGRLLPNRISIDLSHCFLKAVAHDTFVQAKAHHHHLLDGCLAVDRNRFFEPGSLGFDSG